MFISAHSVSTMCIVARYGWVLSHTICREKINAVQPLCVETNDLIIYSWIGQEVGTGNTEDYGI